ncbi:MAG: serine/threonine-protein kinase [Dokdonella sp.]
MSLATERWSEISALFDELVELDPAQRTQRLGELEAADRVLASEVRALLAADESANTMLDSDAAAALPALLADLDAAPRDGTIGSYRLLRSIGQGGMGEVWLGERTDGAYEQQVAVKLLKRGMDTAAILRRFLLERRILARLNHHHIVRLVDGGMSADGRPFYVMDYVDGQPITRFASAHGLDVRARANLLAQVADAVAYAHTQLIVHRDLKPSNVLVDEGGEPRVLDFGIAKLIEESAEQTLTGTGLRVLSPAYAAPEQILGEAIGTTTDVYALGLMLCELLTGQLPQQRRGTTPAQLAIDASQEIVDRASTLAARLDTEKLRDLYGDAGDARQLERKLSGDLDLIIATALQREPSRRYPTAAAFADDLRRWLDGRPIAARADTAGYRLKKFVRRHRAGVATSVLIALALIGGLGAAVWQAHLAQVQAQRADAEAVSARHSAERSKRVTNFLISVFTQEDPLRHTEGGATTLAQAFDDTLKRIDTEFADDPMLQGSLLDDFGEITTTNGKFDQAQKLFERALALAEQTHAADDPAIAETLVNLGVLASYRGNVLTGKPYLQRAVAILAPHAHDLPGDYANALSALGNALNQEGKMRESARLMHQVLDIARETKAAPEIMIASLSNTATSDVSLGNFIEAESLASEALDIAEHAFGKNSANVIPPLWTLETAAYHRGDLEREQRLVERRLAVARAVFPPSHPWAISALGESGFMLMRTGQMKEGESRMREALHLLDQAGNDGQEMRMIQRRLWIGLHRQGDGKAAQVAIEAAWKSCTAQQQQEQKMCLTVRANRAQSLAEAGQGELALREADAAAQSLKEKLGERSDEFGQALEARASALMTLHRRDDALSAQREAAAMFEAVYGAQHPATLSAREELAKM